jgi:hypothetical protein
MKNTRIKFFFSHALEEIGAWLLTAALLFIVFQIAVAIF